MASLLPPLPLGACTQRLPQPWRWREGGQAHPTLLPTPTHATPPSHNSIEYGIPGAHGNCTTARTHTHARTHAHTPAMEQQQTEQQQLANYPAKTRGGGILRLPFLGRFANKDEEQDKNSNAAAQPPQRRRSCDWSAAPLVTECSSDEDVAEGEGASLRAMAEGSHLHVRILPRTHTMLTNTKGQKKRPSPKVEH